jgi:MFS family permease
MSDLAKPSVRRALAQRNYRLFVTGQLVSLVGTWTQSVAESWLVYRLTGSAAWLGVAAFCQQVPAFFLATVGGLVADRHRKRTILILTQSTAMTLAFVLAALTISGRVRVGHLLVMATLLGVVRAFDSPTRQAFVVDMVGRENLASAISLNSSLITGAAVLGPAIAGIAIDAVGEGWCFILNGASFVAVIIGLLAMRDLPAPIIGRTREPLFFRVIEGFRFAATDERLRALFLMLALTAFMGIPSATLMPVFASKILHGDARTLGWLMGAQGIGALVAGLIVTTRSGGPSTYRFIGLACGTLGIMLVVFALSRTLWISLAIATILGATTFTQVTATNTLVQMLTPDALRGRVMAIWVMILMGFAPLGSLVAGSIATATTDPRVPLVAGGIACALGSLVFARWLLTKRPTS